MAKVETTKVVNLSVAVIGLRDFNRELKKVLDEGGATGDTLLKEANWRVAQYIVEKSQARAATIGRMQAKAAQSMKASRRADRSEVFSNINDRNPFFFGAEFGARQNILRKPRKAAGWAGPGRYWGYRQFLPWRGNKGEVGYFLFPTMREESPHIKEMYGEELEQILSKVFPEQLNG